MRFLFLSLLYLCLKFTRAETSLGAVASATDLDYLDLPLQRTPDGGAYLVNLTFIEDGLTVPMKLELSSAQTWVNTYTTYCWNHGNLLSLSNGACGVTSGGSPPADSPTPAYLYTNSDGTYMYGKHSNESLALDRYQVYDQDVILADQSWILPDEISAGVLGLAYPEALRAVVPPPSNLTSISKAEPTTTDETNSDSFLANLFKQHKYNNVTNPLVQIISLAISRDLSGANNAGILTVGNWAEPLNPQVNVTNVTIARDHISTTNFSGTRGTYNDTSMQYAVQVDGLTVQNTTKTITTASTNSAMFPQMYYLSTSETTISLPPQVAAMVNGMFEPPAIPAQDGQTYYVHCNAVAPDFSLILGNTTFAINSLDLKRHASNTLCISTITAGADGHYVLGDTFLRNVLLVLDFRSKLWILASRPYYKS